MSDHEIITDGGRRRRWSSSEKLRIVEETLDETASISAVARRNGVAPNLLYRWRASDAGGRGRGRVRGR
jgi:transposase